MSLESTGQDFVFIIHQLVKIACKGRKDGHYDAPGLSLCLYGVKHMVKDHSDSERGNLLLLFSISSKGSFICTIPQTG